VPDFYEIDFLPVHRSDSGDAISVRYQIGEHLSVHVIDGGYESTAEAFAQHIRDNYGTDHINRVVVTHPDQDHAEGLAPILEQFTVDELWMLCPWDYASQLLPHFARYNSVESLRARLRDDYPYIAALEEIATRRGIRIREPFQGAQIGPFTVLAPSPQRFLELILESERTPQRSVRSRSLLGEAYQAIARPIVNFIKAGWGSEKFSPEPTSVENEMSVIQYATLCGHKVLLTGDAGRDGMTEAADYAPNVGLSLPGVAKFQVPHHGGRRNVSTELLDRWLGPRLPQKLPEGEELFTAMISSAKEDPEHPRKAVLRGLMHRGARIATTEDGAFRTQRDAPLREGWVPLKQPAYPDEQEE
jgi:beta-lactamase superfamily II metal-dependent hydrolase